ncbi:MAG: hypothetical protein R3325_04900, partial [Thermoanaerobaculia bacterium]|nr:hypothetical protein [Thermoanaerobaculia bacterium]
MRPPPRALGLPRSRPRGSAYVLTLMAMVVLAVAGLSLAVVTRMERQLGVNERTLQEIFYASESGLALATVRTLALRDRAAFELTLPRRSVGATHVADRLRVSAS